jgi:hypothetical protein
MRLSRATFAAFLVACLAVPALATAQGGYQADPTREQFVAQADPKCKRANAKSRKQFKKVEGYAERGKYRAAGERLIRGEKIQLDLYDKLAELDRPPADAKTIRRWLAELEDGTKDSIGAGKDLKKKRFKAADAGLEEADEHFRKARKKVRDFGFRYCS